MIDIHTHVLPGVDDGSPSVDVSLRVLRAFAAGGVRTVVCTPHLDASRARHAPSEKHLAILESLRAVAPPEVELLPGWEIMLDTPGADLTAPYLSLGESSAILVEFPRIALPPHAHEELFRLRMAGRVPVLAHPERYWGCTLEMIEKWKSAGVVIQTDAAALLSRARRGLVEQMLQRGLVDILASDTHGDRRSLVPVREWLVSAGNEEWADLLTRENAKRLLASEPLYPVPPWQRKRGFVTTLRDFFSRR